MAEEKIAIDSPSVCATKIIVPLLFFGCATIIALKDVFSIVVETIELSVFSFKKFTSRYSAVYCPSKVRFHDYFSSRMFTEIK